MRILFITDNFPPEVNAPASRTFEHCREWVKNGHEVTVVTCFPNFPDGKVYAGYANNMRKIEHMDGIRIVRVWSYIAANQGFFPRIMDYISFMVSASTQSLRLGHFDRIIGTSPQFFSAVAAYIIGSIKGTPWIFELRDIWPESIKAVGAMKDSKVFEALERLELYLYGRSSHIVAVTNSFKNNLSSRGISTSKIAVIRNGVDRSRFYPRGRNIKIASQYGVENTFNVGYIGTHGMAHALETVLEAARRLQEFANNGGSASDIKIIFLGGGANKPGLISRSQSMNLNNVLFLNSVPKDLVVEYWSLLDLSLVHLKRTDLFKTVIPSKIFESMGMGVPILHGVQGESLDIVEENAVGWGFTPEDPQSLVEAILYAYRNPVKLKQARQNCDRASARYERSKLAFDMLKIVSRSV